MSDAHRIQTDPKLQGNLDIFEVFLVVLKVNVPSFQIRPGANMGPGQSFMQASGFRRRGANKAVAFSRCYLGGNVTDRKKLWRGVNSAE